MVRKIPLNRLAALTFAVLFLAAACSQAEAAVSNSPATVETAVETSESESPALGRRAKSPSTISYPAYPASDPTPVPLADVELMLFVGDSISAQLHFAAMQRSSVRGGPDVRWLLSTGSGANDAWPDLLDEFIDDPAATAIITTFGVWQTVPTGPAAVDVDATRESLLQDITAFMAPMATSTYARPTQALLLHSIDHPEADADLQQANAMIGEVADDFSVPVDHTLPGVDSEGAPAFVSIEGLDLPVRNELGDETHYCAGAALVMADALLDEVGVETLPLTLADVEALYALAPENYFARVGC